MNPTRRSLPLPAALVGALLLGACAATSADGPGGEGPARITGRLRADRVPPDAVVEIDRDESGPPVPVPGTSSRLDDLGRFETPHLVPGRYLVVLRTRENPPSVASAVVPQRTETELRLTSPGAGTTVTLISPPGAPRERVCRLCPAESRTGVPDRREVLLLAGTEVRLAGLAPGLWRVDVLPDGATADFVVPRSDQLARLLIDPPASPATGPAVQGTVRRSAGEPAFGATVTVRMVDPDMKVAPWGRFGPVGPDGSYRVDRLAAGVAYVRVESRDAAFRAVPSPTLITISPSSSNAWDWSVEP